MTAERKLDESGEIVLELATGERKIQLEEECAHLLEDPNFDASSFKTFLNDMVNLLGGIREESAWNFNDGIESHLVDQEGQNLFDFRLWQPTQGYDGRNYSVRLSIYPREKPKTEPHIKATIWEGYSEVKRNWTPRSTPSSGGEFVFRLNEDLIYPEDYEGPTFFSYATGEELKPFRGKREVNLRTEHHPTGVQLRDLAAKIFEVYQGGSR